MNAEALSPPAADSALRHGARRVAVMLVALAAVALSCAAVAWLMWPVAPQQPVRMPFGLAREAAPATTGLGGYLLALQGRFYKGLEAAVTTLKDGNAAIWPLLGIGFAYGVFHAAGPGHGKGVISAYLLANERSLRKGLAVCLAAAMLQALVAIAIVVVAAIALNVTARTMTGLSDLIEIASFAIVALLGLAMSWRKAGKLLAVATIVRGRPDDATAFNAAAVGCDHVHLPPPDQIDAMHRWRDLAGVVLAAGTRPCSGALILLVFALSQGLFAAGIAATFAMALGTAITTGIIAAIAVFAKALALKLAGGRGATAPLVLSALELAAAAFVAVLGLSLMLGLWIESGGS